MAALGAAFVLAAFAGATAWLFFAPPTDETGPVDAVVVLGPGTGGERYRKAIDLMEAGLAPVLVVSEGRSHSTSEEDLCRQPDERFEVICFQADPFSTRGEARTVSRLAAARAWRSLLVVTSTYHVVRARMLFSRCFRGRLDVVGAHPPAGLRLARDVAHEWIGLLYALTVAQRC